MDSVQGQLKTLDIDDDYYDEVFVKVPNVKEDHETIKKHNLLVDGDDKGYLIQIFTENTIGPIFFEFIQRNGHYGFGEGNFGALFRAIERDQKRRGVL
jgi:4-hydroxyphenylpyruvate dioxygenase